MLTKNKAGGIRTPLKGAAIALFAMLAAAGCGSTKPAVKSLPDSSSNILQSNFQVRRAGGYWIMLDGRSFGGDGPYREGFRTVPPAPNFAPDARGRGFIIAHGDNGFWIVRDYGAIEPYGDAPRLCEGLLYNCTGYQTGKGGSPVAAAPLPPATASGWWDTTAKCGPWETRYPMAI